MVELLKRISRNWIFPNTDLDGSQTPAPSGGEEVKYQDRKKCKTINGLYLTDRPGLLISISDPVEENHNDLYNIEVVTCTLNQAEFSTDDLSLNPEVGFDAKDIRKTCEKNNIKANICFMIS